MFTVLEFQADWCQPCKTVEPQVEKLAQQYGLGLQKVNVDKEARLVEGHGVSAIPTLIVTSGSRVLARFVGGTAGKELQGWLGERIKRTA